MKKIVLVFALALAMMPAFSQTSAERVGRLRQHVYYFAADSLNGRKAGSPDAAKAAAYIINEFEAIGLKPYFSGWKMPFTNEMYPGLVFNDVVAVIEGSDPALRDQFIVVGAHYDHLGVKDGKVYNGADDNASGTAAVIEVARELYARRGELGRSVILAAFDAEEIGLFGSNALSDSLKGKDIRLMMSLDMVGWYKKSGKLKLEGVGTIKNGKNLIRSIAEKNDIRVETENFEASVFTATDTEGFAQKQFPTLAVTTGLKSPYHKPEDDADLIDYEGLDKVCSFIGELTVKASSAGTEPSGRVAMKHSGIGKFRIGLQGELGSSVMNFKDAGFTGKTDFSWNAGLTARWGLNRKGTIGMQASVLYGQYSCMVPDPANLYTSAGHERSSGITVPVQFVLQTPSVNSNFFIGLGAWYRHLFTAGSSCTSLSGTPSDAGVASNAGGPCFTFGFTFGHIGIALEQYWQANRYFTSFAPGTPHPIDAKMNTSMFRMTYYF